MNYSDDNCICKGEELNYSDDNCLCSGEEINPKCHRHDKLLKALKEIRKEAPELYEALRKDKWE